MKTWRFISSGKCDPAMNMAIDEAILTAHSEGRVPPTVRFYSWDPATLSIGYFQKAEDEVDLAALFDRRLGFVRRPTGGRAVLHDRELTYSIIVSEDYPGLPRTVNESYRVLSEGLVIGFRLLDLEAQMVNLGETEQKSAFASASSAACFDSPSWYELVVEGRKTAGSAQTRQKGVVLQHGSILLDLDADLLFSVLRFPNERVRERLKRDFRKKAAAINDLRRERGLPPISLCEAERAFYRGIGEGLGVELIESALTSDEERLARKLAEEKYGSDEWNLRR